MTQGCDSTWTDVDTRALLCGRSFRLWIISSSTDDSQHPPSIVVVVPSRPMKHFPCPCSKSFNSLRFLFPTEGSSTLLFLGSDLDDCDKGFRSNMEWKNAGSTGMQPTIIPAVCSPTLRDYQSNIQMSYDLAKEGLR